MRVREREVECVDERESVQVGEKEGEYAWRVCG